MIGFGKKCLDIILIGTILCSSQITLINSNLLTTKHILAPDVILHGGDTVSCMTWVMTYPSNCQSDNGPHTP